LRQHQAREVLYKKTEGGKTLTPEKTRPATPVQLHFERDVLPVLRLHNQALRKAVARGCPTATRVLCAYKQVLHRHDESTLHGLKSALNAHGIAVVWPPVAAKAPAPATN